MRLLLDTHLLLWSADDENRLPVGARALLSDPDNELIFSVVSIWETAIKAGLKRHNLRADARQLRRRLLDNGYTELPLTGAHAVTIDLLPPIHKDPFDHVNHPAATKDARALGSQA